MLPSGHVQKSRILSSGFANCYKSVCNIHDCSHLRTELKPRIQVLMLEYTGCHVLATVVAMYVGLYLALLCAASSDAERSWLPCVGNSSCHVCWTISAIAICYKFSS